MNEFLSNAKTKDFLRLQVPESEKTHEWYKFHADRLIPAHVSLVVEGYGEKKKMYEFINI